MTTGELKNIQTGDTVSVRGVVKALTDNNVLVTFKLKSGQETLDWVSRDVVGAAYALPSAPKYDPCRLLRKGDRVQVKKRNGRCNGKHGEYLREAFCEVAEDEVPNELVRVYHNSSEYLLDPAYLELVTPVEELEPYFVVYDDKFYHVHKKGEDSAVAVYSEARHPHAKAAAEAECARLNAEHRKEQK